MSVRIKTLVVIGLTFLALLGLLYFTSLWFLLQGAIVTEEKSTTRDVTRLLAALDDQIAVMDATVGDWAPWDDTYEFISSGDTGYIDSNLPIGTFTNLGVELMLFINNSGQIVFGKMVDLDSQAEIPFPESLYSELQVGGRLLSYKDPSDKMAGILSLPEGAMIIASQPIVTSQGEGPIRGTLIMGRRLDEAEIAKLSQRTQLSISTFPYNDDVLPDDVALARNSLVGVKPIFVAPQSETVVSGYTLVNDVYGNPALILRVDTPREAFTQAKTSMRYLGLALLAIGIVLGLVTMLLLERMVITRLTSLNSSVMKIGSQGTASSRVEANGNDEIFVLATSVNSMLDSLENSRAKERESEERYKNITTISPVGIFRTDLNGATTYVNPMWCHLSGLSVDEALGDGWLSAVHPEDKESLTKGWQETTRLHKASFADYRFVRPDGTVVWVMGQAIPEMNSENQIVGYVGTITDITERKQAEEEIESLARFPDENPNPILRVEQEGQIIYANLASEALLRLWNCAVGEYLPTDWRERVANAARNSAHPTVEVECEERVYSIMIVPIPDLAYINIYGTDITEGKRAEEALRESENRLRTIVEGTQALLMSVDTNGHFTYANEATARAVGFTSPAELIGKAYLHFIHPEDRH
ncbi:MAG: PAS domain S-box protein, partial [Chloroflexi bacterium]|nr:PAS domain S-box protein [Chloroflexota bacterium]